jgi:hypothetical protein
MVQEAPDEVDDGGLGPAGGLRRIAADRGPNDREDSRPDDDANAKRGERDRAEGFLEGVLRQLRFRDQLVDGLGGEDLSGQRGAPWSKK